MQRNYLVPNLRAIRCEALSKPVVEAIRVSPVNPRPVSNLRFLVLCIVGAMVLACLAYLCSREASDKEETE